MRVAGPAAAVATAGLVVAVDQATKQLAATQHRARRPGRRDPRRSTSPTRATRAWPSARSRAAALIVAILIGAVAGRCSSPTSWPTATGRGCGCRSGCCSAGALGNLADRAREGAVIDFIDPIAWPAFNVADSCIVVGVLVLLWVVEGRPQRPAPRGGRRGRRPAPRRLPGGARGRPLALGRPAADRAGAVQVDGRARPKNHRIAAGEVVTVEDSAGADGTPPDAAPDFEVVYEDADLLVVDKPAGAGDPPRARAPTGPRSPGALRGRAAGGPDPERAGIVHRLDRDTSGLLVVAKTEEAHAALLAAAARRARSGASTWRSSRAGRTPRAARSTPRSAATAHAARSSPRAATAAREPSPTSR